MNSIYFIKLFFIQYGTTSFFKVFDNISIPLDELYHRKLSISSDIVSSPSNKPLYLYT